MEQDYQQPLIQTSFSLEDLKQSMKYVRNMQGIPVIE